MSRNRLKGLGAVIQILDTSGIDLEILSENLYRFSNNLLTVDIMTCILLGLSLEITIFICVRMTH